MSSKRFEIDIGLNASGVAKGAKDGETALADLVAGGGAVADESGRAGGKVDSFAAKLVDASRKAGKSDDDIKDALRQMGLSAKQAERAVEKVGDEFTETGRDGDRAADKLEDSLAKARRETKQLGDAADDAGDQARRGMERAEEGVQGFKAEAMQSARETAASFDGSFESIADLGQEVAANAFADFGPAGAAAGLLVAGATGVMVDAFNKVEEAADEARDSAFSLAYDVAGALESAGYTARISEWTSDTEKFKQVTDLANVSGWEQVDVIDALASGGPKLDKLSEAFAAGGATTSVTVGRLWELEAVIKATNDGYISGADAAALAERANYQYATSVGIATGETDALGNAIFRLPDETEVAVNAETKRATEDIQRVEDKINTLPDGHSTVRVSADTSDVDRAMRRINGTTLRIGTRIVTSGDGWDR